MSELAFDCNGEPFTFHARTKRLRVRWFRNPGMRGAPEVVPDELGAQLYVPPVMSSLEFRKRVREPGRYRLDQCDEDGNPIKAPGGENVTSAYVTIIDPKQSAAGSQVSGGSGGGGSGELERAVGVLSTALANSTRTMAENYAAVTAQNGDVIRAATALLGVYVAVPRENLPALRNGADPDDGDDGDDESEEIDDESEEDDDVPPQTPTQKMIADLLATLAAELPASLIQQVVPRIRAWAFDRWQKAATPQQPSAAAQNASGPSTSAQAAAPSVTKEPPRAAAGAASSTQAAPESSSASPAAVSGATTSATPPASAIEPSSKMTPAQMDHLMAISARLTSREAAIILDAAQRMTDAQRAAWLAELSGLGLDQAVALVRSMIATVQGGSVPAAPTTTASLTELADG